MKRPILYILASLIFSLAACEESFLRLVSPSQATAGNFYKNTSDITNAVSAAYAPLQDGAMYQHLFISLMELRSDNLENQNPGGNAGTEFNIDRFLAGPENSVISGAYFALYNAISRCNNTLVHLDVVADENLRDQYEGELRFLRALHYFNIVRLWGAAPLVLEPLSTEESKHIGRNPVEEVYAAIEEDLITAASLLPAIYASDADMGRATAGAAKALLGKVYLTEKKFSEAANIFKELVPAETNPFHYTLLDNVADVFDPGNKLNDEVIFAVRYDKSIPQEGHNISFSNPILDPNLLEAYEAADTRRDLLNTVPINGNTAPVKKYYDTYDPTNQTVGNDFIVLRYADILLMYSEALNELGYSSDPNSDNFKYLNMVRSRAKATPFTPSRLPDQDSFRKAVLQERRLELPLELHRWFDLTRTETATEALQNSGLTKTTIQPYQYLYPIPQGQIEVMHDPDIFPQNPGY